MKPRLRKCNKCKTYTLKEACPKCGSLTVSAHPAPFSPDDRFLEYKIRNILKRD